MEKPIILFSIIFILGCSSNKEFANFPEQEKTITYVDSVPGFSFEKIVAEVSVPSFSSKKPNNVNSINLVFLKQFKDSIEIYMNNNKVEKFYKNDYHYDDNGNEYVIHDEAPKIESKIISFESKSKNCITIVSKNSKVKVSIEINKNYDNYLISYYNNHWYFIGTKSKHK